MVRGVGEASLAVSMLYIYLLSGMVYQNSNVKLLRELHGNVLITGGWHNGRPFKHTHSQQFNSHVHKRVLILT